MDYINQLSHLIELERKAEMKRHQDEIAHQTPEERQRLGKCELNLKGKKGQNIFHYQVVKFTPPQNKILKNQIKIGDLVLISRGTPLESNTTGTITESSRTHLSVAFDSGLPDWIYRAHIRIDLYSNDITYQRMLENLQRFRLQKHPLKSLILGERNAYPSKPQTIEPHNKNLNKSQIAAIESAIGTKDIALIHGPPGTGKTTTLAETIYQAHLRGKTILATAESNTATDNILTKIAPYPNLKIVRIGHPARIIPGYEEYSLFSQFQNHPAAQKVAQKKEEILTQKTQQKKYQTPIPRLRRGMSDEEIIRKARAGKTHRGIKKRELYSMYEWVKCQQKIKQNFTHLKEIEKEIFAEIIKNSDIVITTNSMVGSDLLLEHYFDLAIIDEGSQQTEPSTLLPILSAHRSIIAGDDQQLPPTIISREAEEKLSQPFFQKFRKNFPKNSHLLKIQYRMNPDIVRFPSRKFYQNQLKSAPHLKNNFLKRSPHESSDLGGDLEGVINPQEEISKIISPQKGITFLNTSQKIPEILTVGAPLVGTHPQNGRTQGQPLQANIFETQNIRSKSRENHYEACITQNLVKILLSQKISPKNIGIITPYQAQVNLIKKNLTELSETKKSPLDSSELGRDLEGVTEIEIGSVDGFQGREKKIIILSLVRANEKGETGFLKEYRRLNVAITRAQKKLFIIGHSPTLKTDPLYKEWLEEIENY